MNTDDAYMEQYKEKLYVREEGIKANQLTELMKHCISYAILTLILAAVIAFLGFLLCKIPLISILILAFHIQYLIYGIAIFGALIGVLWLLGGLCVYPIKKKTIINAYNRKIRELEAYTPDSLTLAMWAIIDENPEMFEERNYQENTNESTNYVYLENKVSSTNNYSYDSEMRDYEQRTFSFVDASGAYRRWGDDFVDGAGSHVRCPRY